MHHSLCCLLLVSAALAAEPAPAGGPATAPDHVHDMSAMPATWMGSEQVAMVIYPGFTALDLIGPQYAFSSLMGAKVHIVAQTMDPVMSDTGVAIVPTTTLADCPAAIDILFVPGGSVGTVQAMQDPAILAFLRDRGAKAKLVTSVCTGSMVLGAAGLLRGHKATSHWVTRDLLPLVGAEAVDARVVADGRCITGAGVTAGIDLGLECLRRLRDEEYARSVQLMMEYDPKPPVDAGTPAKAGPATTRFIATMCAPLHEQFRVAATAQANAGPATAAPAGR